MKQGYVTGSEQNDTTIPETSPDNSLTTTTDPVPLTKSPLPSPLNSFGLTTLVASLLSLIPEQYQQPVLKNMIRTALDAHDELYIKQSIAYTLSNLKGNTRHKFKAYLGKCLDNGWAEEYEPEPEPEVDQTEVNRKAALALQAKEATRAKENQALAKTKEQVDSQSACRPGQLH